MTTHEPTIHRHRHRHRTHSEHRHHHVRLSPLHLPTISEESPRRSSSPHSPAPRRASKAEPEWPWDSDDEEYIENAPPVADAHEHLGWEIAEYRERLHLGPTDQEFDEWCESCSSAPSVSVPSAPSTSAGRVTPTIRITPPPASTPPPSCVRSPRATASPAHAVSPLADCSGPIPHLDLGASALDRADNVLARLGTASHTHALTSGHTLVGTGPDCQIFRPTPLPWSRLLDSTPSTPAASVPSLPPFPSPSPSPSLYTTSSESLTPSASASGPSWWPSLLPNPWSSPSPPSPGPRISPFEWDSPSPRFVPSPHFGEWEDWGAEAGGSPGPSPNLQLISPRTPSFGDRVLPMPLTGSSAVRFPDPVAHRISDPEEWYSCEDEFGLVDVQRRSIDAQAIAEWRLEVFEEGGGWAQDAGVGVPDSVEGEGGVAVPVGADADVGADGVRVTVVSVSDDDESEEVVSGEGRDEVDRRM